MSNSAVRIVTDSSCDLPAEIADELGIIIVPLSIRFGDEEFIDREQLTVAEFWTRCAGSATLPETAAPAPGQFEKAYRTLADEGATAVVVVSLSGALSATMWRQTFFVLLLHGNPGQAMSIDHVRGPIICELFEKLLHGVQDGAIRVLRG